MTKKNLLSGLLILLISSMLLGACSPQAATTTAATIDPQAIYTQAALTVQAGVQLTKAANPPTSTPEPTAAPQVVPTMDPNIAAALTSTASAVTQPNNTTNPVGNPTATLAALIIPSATKPVVVNQPPAANTGDKCQWVSNDPADNAMVSKNVKFSTYIKVKNTGTSTWNNTYSLRYFSGERFNAPSDYQVQGSVKPNDSYQFSFELTAPASIGKKELFMVVQAPDGRNLCVINLPLEVTE